MDKINVFQSAQDVLAYIKPLRQLGKKVVTTNGCFDILHKGHIQYLSEAAMQGDILIVGVNSDEVVRKLKGPTRPIQKEEDRAYLIAALKMVDAAFIFREETPHAFVETIKPDIHVKGGDYSQDIIEKEAVERNGGKVVIVSLVKGYSTTTVVNKVRNT